ncbi:DUF2851 family protein [Gaetbulibacter saemankumensis]|uniref:DUF2851 family protein n=1 Tax=Gaetbulibacter saemankumensis TaxID=311208 RepID=UPI0004161D8F|nr:DUF2851 family protein [Gaetbulibacter saemankumensis]
MQEHFLHYIWKHKKFQIDNLRIESGDLIEVVSVGQHNLDSGPDFFNAKLRIGDQLWAGNVEIHVKSSDWFLHNHEKDPAYDNVILHVVWEHDIEVFRKDNSVIPTLVLKSVVAPDMLNHYSRLFIKNDKWINCEMDFANVEGFVINNWLERLYFERLEQKTELVKQYLKTSNNNWEAVCFKMLAKNFGLKVNGDAFLSMANSMDFTVVRKSQSSLLRLEALFFGQSGLLESDSENVYYNKLCQEYKFIKQKFGLNQDAVLPVKFFRLRPPNFPTIRLSQFANLYYEHKNLFSEIISASSLDDFYKLFKVNASGFWDTHYNFGKVSKLVVKTLSKSFIDLLLINTVLPLKFCYAKHVGNNEDEVILNIVSELDSEKNAIIDAFNSLKKVSESAMHSQALIQLKKEYCDKNGCLQCAIGHQLIT